MASGNESDGAREEELESNRCDIIMILWADHKHHLCFNCHRSCSSIVFRRKKTDQVRACATS